MDTDTDDTQRVRSSSGSASDVGSNAETVTQGGHVEEDSENQVDRSSDPEEISDDEEDDEDWDYDHVRQRGLKTKVTRDGLTQEEAEEEMEDEEFEAEEDFDDDLDTIHGSQIDTDASSYTPSQEGPNSLTTVSFQDPSSSQATKSS